VSRQKKERHIFPRHYRKAVVSYSGFPTAGSLIMYHASRDSILRLRLGMTVPLLMFSSAREIDSAYFFFLPTSEKYGNKIRRAKCPTRKLSEFTSVNEFFLGNDASHGFIHIFRQS
jgi:hypothetical protein